MVLGIILAHEGEILSLNFVSSVLGCSKQYAHKIISEVKQVLSENNIELNLDKSILKIESKSKPTKPKSEEPKIIDEVEQIINYLNHKTNKRYTTTNKTSIKDIQARLKEGYTLEDFKYVIDVKAQKWLNTNMEDYLRPQTLFGNKFNSYINERPSNEQKISKIESAVIESSRTFDWGLDSNG